MSTLMTQPGTEASAPEAATPRYIKIYSHSYLYYWWPVWVVGYVMALLTGLQGHTVGPPDFPIPVKMHPNPSLGVIFTAVFLVVILLTNLAVRGIASLTVIVAGLALTFLFAYLGWWDEIFRALGNLAMFLNLGFYVFFSTCILLAWLVAMFIYDRTEYWTFRPGQMVHHTLFSSGEQSFDTRGMSITKRRDDLFRHWVLGLGTGDLHIVTSGAARADFVIDNVLFVDGKLQRIQELAAMQPDVSPTNVMTAGAPE